MTEYEEYLAGLGLRYFAPTEVTRYASRVAKGVRNSLPPRELWENIAPTLRVVDQLREELGRPVHLTSIYRSPAYNAAVGGVASSMHLANRAIDLQVPGIFPHAVFEKLKAMRAAGVFKGGLGLYATFVHVDTRGRNATWGG